MKGLDRVLAQARERIGQGRYDHSLRVADLARDLAQAHGLDEDRAQLAGLLHDIAKVRGREKIKDLAQAYQVPWKEEWDLMPQVAHGFIAARMAQVDLGLEDEGVLAAIAYHTTGRAGMGDLEKVIYLADYLEPARDFPGVQEARDMAYQDLDGAMVLALKQSLSYLLSQGQAIALDTVAAWNSYQRG